MTSSKRSASRKRSKNLATLLKRWLVFVADSGPHHGLVGKGNPLQRGLGHLADVTEHAARSAYYEESARPASYSLHTSEVVVNATYRYRKFETRSGCVKNIGLRMLNVYGLVRLQERT